MSTSYIITSSGSNSTGDMGHHFPAMMSLLSPSQLSRKTHVLRINTHYPYPDIPSQLHMGGRLMRMKSWNMTGLLQGFIDTISESALDTENDEQNKQVASLADTIYNDRVADAEDNSAALAN